MDGDYLFIGFTGKGGQTITTKPMSDTGLYLLFKQYCMAAGAGMHATPHSARATAITKLLADGIPHREVQEFSRHSSIQMVEWYDKRRFSVEESPAKELSYGPKKPKR
jgi:integrase